MSLIKNLAGIVGVIGISSLVSLPGFAEVNLKESANNSFSIAQNSPGQSTTNPTNRRQPAGGDSTTPGNMDAPGANTTEDNSTDACVRQGTRGDGGTLSNNTTRRNSSGMSTEANRRNSSGTLSDRSGSDNETLTAERCLDQENENSPTDSTTTPGMRNTPGSSTTTPGTRITPGGSTTSPGI